MTGIDDLAQSMLVRCASHGHSVAEVADRHAQKALRAELWPSPASGSCASAP